MLEANGQAKPGLGDAERAAIRNVIERQLAAFQRDDGAAAFAFAAPAIQKLFGTPEVFMQMVVENYEAVYRPREVQFLGLVLHEGEPAQKVLFTGPDGTEFVALYVMQKQASGEWRINGCLLYPVA